MACWACVDQSLWASSNLLSSRANRCVCQPSCPLRGWLSFPFVGAQVSFSPRCVFLQSMGAAQPAFTVLALTLASPGSHAPADAHSLSPAPSLLLHLHHPHTGGSGGSGGDAWHERFGAPPSRAATTVAVPGRRVSASVCKRLAMQDDPAEEASPGPGPGLGALGPDGVKESGSALHVHVDDEDMEVDYASAVLLATCMLSPMPPLPPSARSDPSVSARRRMHWAAVESPLESPLAPSTTNPSPELAGRWVGPATSRSSSSSPFSSPSPARAKSRSPAVVSFGHVMVMSAASAAASAPPPRIAHAHPPWTKKRGVPVGDEEAEELFQYVFFAQMLRGHVCWSECVD